MEHNERTLPPVTALVAARVRVLRTAKGWTAEQLAREMTDIGVPWERAVVTKLETGRRQSVTVDELVALAIVLGVPVFGLLLPPAGEVDTVTLTPTTTSRWTWALMWMVGEGLLAKDHRRYAGVAWSQSVAPLDPIRRYGNALSEETQAYRRMLEWEVKGDEEKARIARQVHNGAVHEVVSWLLHLWREGIKVMKLEPRLEKAIREIDWAQADEINAALESALKSPK
jgi:transcriptional regulator with XRE-family HTH domain